MSTPTNIKDRLEYLRGELEAEWISYSELAELQVLAPFIGSDDIQLLEAAGVTEKTLPLDDFKPCKVCGFCPYHDHD